MSQLSWFTVAVGRPFARPQSLPHKRCLRGTIAKWFPGKPVKTVLIGHHHPHYSGAVRSFAARGAAVVATPHAASVVRDLVARPFTMAPDAFAKSGRRNGAKVTTFKDRIEVGDGRITAVNVGASSNHTDEYAIFVVDDAILFQGDIGWFVRDGSLRAGRGSAGLLGVIDSLEPKPSTIVQSWPLAGYPASVSVAELRSL